MSWQTEVTFAADMHCMMSHLMHTQKATTKLGMTVSVCHQIEARSQY